MIGPILPGEDPQLIRAVPSTLSLTLPVMTRTFSPETIEARNTFNTIANEVEGHLIRLLSDWQGRKAWKVSGHGGMVAALNSAFNTYCASHGYNVRDCEPPCPIWLSLYCRHGQIVANLRHLPTAQKEEIYLGRTNDAGILTQLYECRKRRTDYTAAEVAAAFQKAYQLECEARELRSAMRDFT